MQWRLKLFRGLCLVGHPVEYSHEVSNIDITITVEVSGRVIGSCSHYVQDGYCIGNVNLAIIIQITSLVAHHHCVVVHIEGNVELLCFGSIFFRQYPL